MQDFSNVHNAPSITTRHAWPSAAQCPNSSPMGRAQHNAPISLPCAERSTMPRFLSHGPSATAIHIHVRKHVRHTCMPPSWQEASWDGLRRTLPGFDAFQL
eukprot:365086-Chlamydomonas_euryale.AAC.12